MSHLYEEIVDFIAAGPSSQAVAEFEASPLARQRVADLIQREKTTGLSPDEASDLDYYMKLEHIMRLAKARAKRHNGL
jgi:hypothetical protein